MAMISVGVKSKHWMQHVDNETRMNAFNMALNAFNAVKDWDPVAAAKYKEKLLHSPSQSRSKVLARDIAARDPVILFRAR